jgi:mycofactocin precursor
MALRLRLGRTPRQARAKRPAAPPPQPQDERPAAPQAAAQDEQPELTAEVLIEEVSIDGMCGVY